MRRFIPYLVGVVVLATACGGDTAAVTQPVAPTTAPPATAETTTSPGPAMAPADIVFEAQSSDGRAITVASVTLPAPGFIAVHGDLDGAPGPVIGHSGLLPEGTSTDVVVTLDEPLTATGLVFPMVHVDVDEDGDYLFAPPDNAVDGPALTESGEVAVTGAQVTVETATAGSLIIGESDLGPIVTDEEGNTLYVFLPDDQSDSVCYDQCEAAWPPLVGAFTAGSGVDATLLGTTTRTDGSLQVTYDGWPLYYFANDNAPGDTNGQGLNDVWFVVDAEGTIVGR